MKYDVDKTQTLFDVETGSDIKKLKDFTKKELRKIILELIEENGTLESELFDLRNEVDELKDEVENLEDFCQDLRGLA